MLYIHSKKKWKDKNNNNWIFNNAATFQNLVHFEVCQ